MMVTTPPLEKAIEDALKQVRAELIRFYGDGDVGKIELHVGKKQIRVKATPERSNEPVQFE
jgi:hypothetical protein